MPAEYRGINTVKATLASGEVRTYYYHRKSGLKIEGEPGSAEFNTSLAAAQAARPDRDDGTLAGLLRKFESTSRWRKLAPSTQKEYKRVFTFWADKFGTLPNRGLEAKGFRRAVLDWHDEASADHPREADNRVTILARVLSWGAKDGPLNVNVLNGFERAYDADRADMIWLPEHVEAFMAVADEEMQLALMLAMHTGQRQADIRALAWGNYDGRTIRLRQGKTKRNVIIPCTKALKAVLDAAMARKRGPLMLMTKTGRAFQKRYLAERWAKTFDAAKITADLNFHDLRGTAVTMLCEAGCTVPEIAAITGHSSRTAQEILDRYMARTSVLATSAIIKLDAYLEDRT
jgi:integrase